MADVGAGRTIRERSRPGSARWRAPLRWPALLLVALVRIYQLVVSPWVGPTCRFYPSCSAYAVEALRTRGALMGTWLAVRRLLRCHPWNPGGVDPVPPRGSVVRQPAPPR